MWGFINTNMKSPRSSDGRFLKGVHYSTETEFKKGSHWRKPKPYWNRDWLVHEYCDLEKPANQIAEEQGCFENNILYFLKKFQIKTRSMKEIRKIKYWGLIGEKNPMWKGGISSERDKLNHTPEWKKLIKYIHVRDKNICQLCEMKHIYGEKTFHLHHIKSFSLYPKLRLEPSNILLLCKECHVFIHSNANENKLYIED